MVGRVMAPKRRLHINSLHEKFTCLDVAVGELHADAAIVQRAPLISPEVFEMSTLVRGQAEL